MGNRPLERGWVPLGGGQEGMESCAGGSGLVGRAWRKAAVTKDPAPRPRTCYQSDESVVLAGPCQGWDSNQPSPQTAYRVFPSITHTRINAVPLPALTGRQTRLHWTHGPQPAPRAPPLQLRMTCSWGGRAEPLWARAVVNKSPASHCSLGW